MVGKCFGWNETRQNQGRGLVDHKPIKTPSPTSSNFVAQDDTAVLVLLSCFMSSLLLFLLLIHVYCL